MTHHSPSAVRRPVFVWLDWPPFVEVHLFGDLSLTKGHCGSFELEKKTRINLFAL